jgi:parallel beta-helix repeat protein
MRHFEQRGGVPRGRLLLLGLLAAAWLAMPVPGARADQVACGQVITTNTTLSNSLNACSGDGLVIGASGVTVDLGGHAVVGVGLGIGVRNDGHADVTIRNGTVQNFDYGVVLNPGTVRNAVTGLNVTQNEWAAIQLNNASENHVGQNHLAEFSDFALHATNGSSGNAIVGNTIGAGAGEAFVVDLGSNHNWLEANKVLVSAGHAVRVNDSSNTMVLANDLSGSSDVSVSMTAAPGSVVQANTIGMGGDAGVVLSGADTSVVRFNAFGQSGDAGVILSSMSNSLVKGNAMALAGDAAIVLREGSNNIRVIDNMASHSSDAGIFVADGGGNVLRGNILTNNAHGVELSGGNQNVVEFNALDTNLGLGIEVSGSSGNTVFGNTMDGNLQGGIWVDSGAIANTVSGNAARGNGGDGMTLNGEGTVVQSNLARQNLGWGIYAGAGIVDAGGNGASGNAELAQCYFIACSDGSDWVAPVRPPEPLDPLELGLPGTTAVGPRTMQVLKKAVRKGGRRRVAVVTCKRRRATRGRAARNRVKAVCKASYRGKRTSRRVTGRLVRNGKAMARGARKVRGARRGSLSMLARKPPAATRYKLVLSYRDARHRATVVRRTVRVRYLAD